MSGNRSKSAFFEGGWVTLSADFRGMGASPTNHCWYQSSRVIALSCGIKISVVRHLVVSQSTRVTDRRTDERTDRQNYDSQDRPRICSRGKNVWFRNTGQPGQTVTYIHSSRAGQTTRPVKQPHRSGRDVTVYPAAVSAAAAADCKVILS